MTSLTGYLSADDIAEHLEDAGVGTFGHDITAGNMPEGKNKCVTVFDTGGAPPEQEYPVDHASFSIMVRDVSSAYNAAKQRAQDIYQLLNRRRNLLINTKDVMFVAANAPPQSIGPDEKGRHRFTLNITAKIRRSDEE